MLEIVFWQGIVSPHMACLAKEAANLGHKVRYMAAEPMSKDRVAQGWSPPDMRHVRLEYVANLAKVDSLLKGIFPEAVHVVQGIRGNGYVGYVIDRLKQRSARWGTVIETVNEPVFVGPIKRLVYKWKLGQSPSKPDFVLAIGEKTPSWVAARSYPEQRIFPFTYFLEIDGTLGKKYNNSGFFRVGFVGQITRRKRVDILIDALATEDFNDTELVVVGIGPLEAKLKSMATRKLRHLNMHWLGQLPMSKARLEIAALDCLVLPSSHDGWGAVVSEALMAGVPAICSDACGAAVAVRASGVGGVFPSGDAVALRQLLSKVKADGCKEYAERQHLAHWASCFGVTAGAVYLERIFESVYNDGARPSPPWIDSSSGIPEAPNTLKRLVL